jgi:hypothetical protein
MTEMTTSEVVRKWLPTLALIVVAVLWIANIRSDSLTDQTALAARLGAAEDRIDSMERRLDRIDRTLTCIAADVRENQTLLRGMTNE